MKKLLASVLCLLVGVLPVLAQNPVTTTYLNAQKQASPPANPPAGYNRIWVGTDNFVKVKQPDGTTQFMPYYLSSLDGIVLATSGVLSQFAPAPGGGDAAKFLRGDGTWADAAGGGGFELQTETSFTNNSTPAIYLKAPSPNTTPFLQFLDNSNASMLKVYYDGGVESAGDFYTGTGRLATTGTSITLRTAGNTDVGVFREYGSLSFEAAVPSTSGVPKAWLDFTGIQNNTGITASTEYNAFWYNPPRTYTWATGAITNQRFFYMRAPTIAFSGTSTVTTAATLAISGAPIAGTNATITNPYALWVGSGTSQFDGNVSLGSSNVLLLAGATSPGTATKFQLGTPATTDNAVNIYIEPTSTTTAALAIQANASQSANLVTYRNSAGTTMGGVLANGQPYWSNGLGGVVGYGGALNTTTTALNVVAIGLQAGEGLTNGGTNILIGSEAGRGLTTGSANVFIGYQAVNWDTAIANSVVIGSEAFDQGAVSYTGTGPVLAIGQKAGADLTTQNNIAVFGSSTSPLNDWYFGESYSTASPSDITFQPSVASGTNIAGSSFYLRSGAGTGNATPGKLYLQYASAGSSGATVQSYTTAVTIDSTATDVAGLLQVDRIAGTTSAPSISAGAAAGTTPTVSVTGTDLAGEIVITTGTGSVGSGTLATITLNTAFANDCYPVLQAADADSRAVAISITHSSTGFTIVAGAAGWNTSTEYKWTYIVAGR